ncbi:hypothetical protein BU26DRAFT_259895 [Trematosphaeria pertusa]|uniref:Uncharacterized protein n=1 Tax=Trematosphaeria pertusa TaxID=390896 RepID=A0A6A6ISN2_9PLEO|nr:uncharacterized protein BU26DRAFT_259895 [Trematosphaeria pertusa]KAF2252610.1 hypothetical protein BU26DRAFT_259895 [Trematosphaeria pertusa]
MLYALQGPHRPLHPLTQPYSPRSFPFMHFPRSGRDAHFPETLRPKGICCSSYVSVVPFPGSQICRYC